MQTVDCRGLSCPEPVLKVRKVLTDLESGQIQVYVSTGAARDNIKFLAEKMGWQIQSQQDKEEYIILLSR